MKSPGKWKRGLAIVGGPIHLSASKTCATAEAGSKKGLFYKPLPKEFWRDGCTYRQIAREDHGAIYEQTWKNLSRSVCFEVIRIRRRDGFHIGDRFVEPAEVCPNSEAWGSDGFTLTDKDAAFEKLRELA